MVGGANLPGNRHLIDGRLVVRLIRCLGDGIKSYRGVGQLTGCVAISDYRQALDGIIIPIYTLFRTSPAASNNPACYSLKIRGHFKTDSMTA